MDKQNGHLTYLMYDSDDTQAPVHAKIGYDIEEHIERVKKLVEQPVWPEVCHEVVPDGKSGNQKLAVGCSYCQYKHVCWSGLRTFLYSSGPRYLTEVVNEPKVQEIS
jgi:DNA-binding Lrp family transcriptional regulator